MLPLNLLKVDLMSDNSFRFTFMDEHYLNENSVLVDDNDLSFSTLDESQTKT